jgi:membrane protein
VVRFVLGTARRFLGERAPEGAAGMAFYAVFSLFPILLILAAVGGRVLQTPEAQEHALELILKVIPASFSGLIRENMQRILASRGAAGLVGTIGLLWAATSGFAVLARNVNRAWPGARDMNILRARLTALVVVGSLSGLTALLLAARSLVRLLSAWGASVGVPIDVTAFERVPSGLLLCVLVFVTLLLLYRIVPMTRVRWRHAGAGALAATVGCVAATAGFAWYLGSGLARYNIVYGSLGALLAFLSWVYIVSLIVLLGAHLSAAVGGDGR